MFQVRQSATGQFVLVDPATDTVVVADDLREGYERMTALVGAAAEAPVPDVAASKTPPGATGWPKLAVIGVLAVLPFVWIGALHLTLGRLLSELRAQIATPESGDETRARLERLERRIDQLGPGGKRPKAKAPKPAAVVDEETGDEG